MTGREGPAQTIQQRKEEIYMRTKRLNGLLSWLLCLCMAISLLPVTALAANFPSRFYASISLSSSSESFGKVSFNGTYTKTGTTKNRVISGMEYAGGVFFTVEGNFGRTTSQNGSTIMSDDGWRELRVYNGNLNNYQVIGEVNAEGGAYTIVDTAIDLSGEAPVLYGTYNYSPQTAISMICTIDLETAQTKDWKMVTGLTGEDVIYAIAFDEDGTLYAVGADKSLEGGQARLYTIDLDTGKATLVGDIKSPTNYLISTNFAQDMAFDYATGTLYWAENKKNEVYTIDTDSAVATYFGQVKYSGGAYALQSFCIPYDTAFGQNNDRYMVSVICAGGGKVTDKSVSGDEGKTFYMVESGDDLTLAITPDDYGKLLSVKVDGKDVSLDGLTDNGYAFSNVTANHVIEVTFRDNLPVTQKDMTWFHYQGYEASFYTQHHAYKFYELPYVTDAPKDGYTQTLLDKNGQEISNDTVILAGNYDVHVTHEGTDKYNALDVIYKDALQLAKCPGTPGRPVVYGKVGCTQGDLTTTSALQDYYGTDGKLIDAAHDDIPVTLVWLNPETTYNEEGNFYANATIYAAQELDQRLKDCYTLDDGKPLTEGCQISSRATQVVVLPADQASLIKVQASDDAGGTVSGKGVYKNGDKVAVTATVNANDGYEFKGWQDESGQTVSENLTYEFKAGGDRTLTALFELSKDYTVRLTVDPTGAGTVTGGGSYDEGNEHEATVTATANKGYYFIGWYKGDNLESANASYQFTVPKDGITFTAKFGVDLLARAEMAKDNLASALGTSVFEWSTLTEAVDAYETAKEFVDNPPEGVEDAEGRFQALTGYYSGVKELDLSNQGLDNEDLTELYLFTGVTELNLSGNKGVTSLSNLNMTKLETLDLSNTVITDLSGLSAPTKLETLNLSNNTALTDLSVLSSLTNLKTLNLSGNKRVSDLSALRSLGWLETLDISNTSVTAFDTLVNENGKLVTPGLKTLTAQKLSLISLSALAGLQENDMFWFYTNLWDFTGSTLPDTEENQADVNTIQEKINIGFGKFIPPTIGNPEPPSVEPEEPVTPSGSNKDDDDDGYSVSVPASSSIRGGAITVSPRSADKGDTITITVKPDAGYELDELTVTTRSGGELALTNQGNDRYIFTMPGSDVKIQVSFRETTAPVVNPFIDVASNAYYYDAVLWAVENGITNGTIAAAFSPNVTVTRAQMVTFLWRACGAPGAGGANPFTDVSAGAYYYDAVLWAVESGITNGTTATTFSPDAPVTRAQAVAFQWRAAGSPAASDGSFSDVADNAYYAVAVSWAVANGITNGTTAATFSPNTPVTRAQAVTFLYRELA